MIMYATLFLGKGGNCDPFEIWVIFPGNWVERWFVEPTTYRHPSLEGPQPFMLIYPPFFDILTVGKAHKKNMIST